ncbi:polyprenyl synthetase family protein [Evansella cellulosilytica]|uniref:Polyprenyl synthetase n=1 Tax=Evansella cellulosilytica (strain ATCC 21833 / DSM 2522 / FERM P-1141 / JCM 9156 / N-4) TaxID=649639 RepID=E6U1D8_EVAC2|nr:polyprenyl synthetase family protein [Evansella cellulosilytica]ADU29185.1 Polyprenyl synthetase [Evansella cellulosilytica DSM 2522]
MRVHQMWDGYPELKTNLSSVLSLIESHVRVRDKTVAATINNLVHSGGKLLRPAYSLLCSQIGPDSEKEKAVAVAAAIEAIHMASLVHDDVIDDADTRHNHATIHTMHGNKFAIYSGDYLFCISFQILAQHASSLAHLDFNTRGMEKILAGELDQLNSRFKPSLSVKSYLSRVAGKTAQLFAISCYSGAMEGGATRKQAMNAWNMGHYIGMTFQIMDDILDFKGSSHCLGKPVMSDLQQGIYTLPLIYAMQQKPNAFKPFLEKKDMLTENDLTVIAELIDQYKGVEKAQALADKYTAKALKQLSKLPSGDYKEILEEVTTKLLKRKS